MKKFVSIAAVLIISLTSCATQADSPVTDYIKNETWDSVSETSDKNTETRELTLAAAGNIDSIMPKIDELNAEGRYSITVKNYLDTYRDQNAISAAERGQKVYEYTIEGFESAARDLEIDIVSGRIPDIVCLDTKETEKLASKGAFADLYEFMDNDEQFQRTSFLPNYLQAAETDGHLYSIAQKFTIKTMAAKTKYIDTENWTFDEFRKAYENRPDGMELFESGNNRNGVFGMLSNSGADFIDLTTQTCSFDSDGFREMLEFCSQFPSVDEYDFENKSCRRDTALLSDMYISSFRDFNVQKQCVFGEDITFVGTPTESGSGSAMLLTNQFSVMRDSENKENAWEFIKEFLKDENFEGNPDGIPVTENGLQKVMETALEPPFYFDATDNNKKVFIEETGYDFYSNERIDVTPMTEDEQKKYEKFVRSVSRIAAENTELVLSEIINDETEAYFKGEYTLEQCAEIIQNRVSIFISEHYT